METAGQPSLEETGGSGGGYDAGHCLRFALNARPSGLAGLRSGSGPHRRKELVTKRKRDILNEVTRGHF